MTLNELRFVIAVAQTRNFRRAAEQSFISQPALSLAIQKLEAELGIKIFERHKSDVSITAIGQQIVAQAQCVLEQVERVRLIARQGKNLLNGILRLGVIHSVGPYLLPNLIIALKQIAPDLLLEVEENITANLAVALNHGKLDAIIVALPFDNPNTITCPLYDENFEVVVNIDHRWGTRKFIKPNELVNEKVLLLDSGHCFSNQVIEACPEINRKGANVQQGTSLETIRNMVASGLGITVLPASANAPRYLNQMLTVIPFAKPIPSRRIAVAWRKSFPQTQAIEALVAAAASSQLHGIQSISTKF